MTLSAQLADWFPLTVTIAPRSGHDGSAPTYGAAVSYSARLELRTRPTRDQQGREVTARGMVFLQTSTIPGGEDKLTLPAGHEPLVAPILRINPQYDELGTVDHVEVEFG